MFRQTDIGTVKHESMLEPITAVAALCLHHATEPSVLPQILTTDQNNIRQRRKVGGERVRITTIMINEITVMIARKRPTEKDDELITTSKSNT